MSSLRRKKREPDIEEDIEEDIEAPIAPRKYNAASPPPPAPRLHRRPAARTAPQKIPPFSPGWYCARSFASYTRRVPRRRHHLGGIISLMRDSVVSFTLGMITVSILLFLDYKDVIRLQSAHDFRNAVFATVQDPETRARIEESLGRKFMSMEEHALKAREVETFPADIIGHEERIREYLADLEVAKKEHAAIKPGYDILTSDPILGLEKFCGECIWDGGTDCFMRLSYLMDKYNLKPIKGKLELMKSTPQCLRKV